MGVNRSGPTDPFRLPIDLALLVLKTEDLYDNKRLIGTWTRATVDIDCCLPVVRTMIPGGVDSEWYYRKLVEN